MEEADIQKIIQESNSINESRLRYCSLRNEHVGYSARSQLRLVSRPGWMNSARYRCSQCFGEYESEKSPEALILEGIGIFS